MYDSEEDGDRRNRDKFPRERDSRREDDRYGFALKFCFMTDLTWNFSHTYLYAGKKIELPFPHNLGDYVGECCPTLSFPIKQFRSVLDVN